MSRSKTHAPELELLRQENRTLKAQVKHLRKELGRFQKRARDVEDLEEMLKESNPPVYENVPASNVCPACNKGVIISTDIGARILISCTNCQHHGSRKA